MTICLAAFSHLERTIVLVSDRMLALGDQARTAENTAAKFSAIHGDWYSEMSGDIGIGSRIVQRAIPMLDPKTPHTALAAGEALEDAWMREHAAIVNSRALAEYGLLQEELSGANPQAARDIASSVLPSECEFLLAGFDPEGYPHVLWLDRYGKCRDCDSFGYWAIGSGSAIAIDSLRAREQSFRYDTATTLSLLLEARFLAEADPGVGRGETLSIVVGFRKRPPVTLTGPEIVSIRRAWQADPRGYPASVMAKVHAMLPTMEQHFTRL